MTVLRQMRGRAERLRGRGFPMLLRLASLGIALRTNERRLVSLRDRERGKRIFVVGNGPSLNHTDIDKLCGEASIASNGIFLLFERRKYRPCYYTIEDQLVAEDRADEANALRGPIKIFPADVRQWLKPGPDTVHIDFIRRYPDFPRFTDDFVRRVWWGGTVTFLNLQLAYYLGASEVFLVGIDHNYAPPAAADGVTGTVIKSNSADQNHFDPRYFGPGYRWHDPRVDRMEAGYRVAKDFFEARGRKIYNATRGGNLEVFPRVEFDSLF